MFPAWFKLKIFFVWVGLLTAVEFVSWLSYSWPNCRPWLTYATWLVVLIISCYRLHYGIYAVFAELVVGSQGYILAAALSGFTISLRLGLFLILFLAAVFDVLRRRKIELLKSFYWKWFVALVCWIIIGVGIAIIYGNSPSNIFYDVNGYLFIGLLFPITQGLREREQLKQLITILFAGVTVLAVQTLFIVFVFSHPNLFQYYLTDIYRWIRDFRIGEITQQSNGFYRVFFQSHLYVVFCLLLAEIHLMKRWQLWSALTAAIAVLLLFLSYSRSFWLATIVILGALWGYQWIISVQHRKHVWLAILSTGLGFILAYGLILAVVNIPIGGAGSGVSASSLLTDRTDNPLNDVGGGSRLALLKPLLQKNLEHPFTGMGFGTTVTYATKDLRALAANPNGLYTTFAFEWGYLDLWLKLGLIGLVTYLLLLCIIVIRTVSQAKQITEDTFAEMALYSMGFGTVAVMIIHVLTPYLNHPLGLGWLILACVVSDIYAKNR
ncbi:MAG: hypothetical protein ACD_43C00264G0005 [uncultured bacterium]|nr:MAG: hypothetical protein ACD_43C00264G0005 [uncultured bacterium]